MEANAITNLSKISLALAAGETAEAARAADASDPMEFIFGIGIEGLTPFELELADKREGDEVVMRVERGRMNELFGHLVCGIPVAAGGGDFYLKAQVKQVGPSDSREVVRAMAGMTECGCGCGGGGGCH